MLAIYLLRICVLCKKKKGKDLVIDTDPQMFSVICIIMIILDGQTFPLTV